MKGEKIVPEFRDVEHDPRLLTHWEAPMGREAKEWFEQRRLRNRIKRLLVRLGIAQ